jgi:hypothetical protein
MFAYIGSHLNCNWCITFVYDGENNDLKIVENSNDFLFLLKNCDFNHARRITVDRAHNISNSSIIDYKFDEELIWGINPFYKGTLHGYVYVYQLLHFCLKNENKTIRILLSDDCQKGIKDLYEKVLGKERCLYVKQNINKNEKGIIIKCNKFVIVENKYHVLVPYSIMDEIMPTILNTFVEKNVSICLIKTNKTQNIVNHGILNEKEIKNLKIPSRFVFIDPAKINECDWASLVYYSKEILVTWGTGHLKLLHYLPNLKIEKLTILVVKEYLNQYNECIKRQHLENSEINWGKNRTNEISYIVYKKNTTLENI